MRPNTRGGVEKFSYSKHSLDKCRPWHLYRMVEVFFFFSFLFYCCWNKIQPSPEIQKGWCLSFKYFVALRTEPCGEANGRASAASYIWGTFSISPQHTALFGPPLLLLSKNTCAIPFPGCRAAAASIDLLRLGCLGDHSGRKAEYKSNE